MIFKSYIIENNIENLTQNFNLFYGENVGLKQDFQNKLKAKFKNSKILNFSQDEILKNNNILFNEINNVSLFENEKIIFINQSNDKILNIIEEIVEKDKEQKIYLFSEILEKKSKLRNFFEKSDMCGSIACYEDNEITIKKIIMNYLKDFKGLSTYNINLILENSNLDRVKLKNEIAKIFLYFEDKNIHTEKLQILLNNKVNENFNILKDEALNGNKEKTNMLLGETTIETEKDIYYLSMINQRLIKLLEFRENNNISKKNIELKINNLKPPIFWKDKANFTKQAIKWSKDKIKETLKKTYDVEIKLKSDTSINKNILLKKLIIDICETANT